MESAIARDEEEHLFPAKKAVSDEQAADSALMARIRDCFQSFVLGEEFSCVAAKAAIRRGHYQHGVYGELASAEATTQLSRELFSFVRRQPALGGPYSTFVASFSGPYLPNEIEFERLLWKQLACLHQRDRMFHRWDPVVSADIDDANFSFSVAGRGYFVVGLHPSSSRWTRRFPWPTLVFNAHYQFEQLRAEGKYQRMQEVIRARELAFQGTINPMLGEFGRRSEARQYSGRAVEADWRCPFSPPGNDDREAS